MTSTRTIAAPRSQGPYKGCEVIARAGNLASAPRTNAVDVGKSKWDRPHRVRGGHMKIVRRKGAKVLKGDRSLSYQLVGPDSTGAREVMITVVDVRPGGGPAPPPHPTPPSTY